MDSIGEMMGRSPVQMAPDTASSDSASKIITGIARIPAPGSVLINRVDPVVPGEDSCDRDRDEICPEGWVNVGPLKGGSADHCHAGSEYFGPCRDELHAFGEMSKSAKKRWSKGCQAYFPCKSCHRDYQQVCPETWSQVGNEWKCKPPAEYSGPCRGDANFEGNNFAMLEAWSEMCEAYWKCRPADHNGNLQTAHPISKDATLHRIAMRLQ